MLVWTWIVRLALPLLLGVLASALNAIWFDAPYAHGVLDILGTIGLVVAMLGIVVWCVCAWLGSEEFGREPPGDRSSSRYQPLSEAHEGMSFGSGGESSLCSMLAFPTAGPAAASSASLPVSTLLFTSSESSSTRSSPMRQPAIASSTETLPP